ncbi:MAG TPA: hypothetical protein VJR04_06885 [Terriglobales bacterium]|nr:hypothetical protein [Terriglobales bacterium]
MSYTVTVVLDRSYGDRLSELPSGQPVWIVDSNENSAEAKRIWAERPDESHLTGITTFKSDEHRSAEEVLIGLLDTIDLHHGSYSADPPYTVINVIGTQVTDKIKAGLGEYGFNQFHATEAGFRAVRPLVTENP